MVSEVRDIQCLSVYYRWYKHREPELHNRRNILKFSIALLLSGVASKAFTTRLSTKATSKNIKGKTIIVIGAGIAGLSAAQTLKDQGAKVIVLEAGNYVGGRIKTDVSMGAPFEYGAGWIHGPSNNNPIQQLAKQVNASTFVTKDDNLEVFDIEEGSIPDAEYERIDDLYERLVEELYYKVNRSDQRSIKEVINDIDPSILQDPIAKWLLSAFVEFDIGAGIEDISAALAFADEAFKGDDVIFTNGYDSILQPLMDGLDIHLNNPVRSVSYSKSGVQVNEYTADYAICTVPLGVLKANHIKFTPSLPATLEEAISELGFGTVTKIALKFEDAFWDVDTQYFGVLTEPKGRWNYWLNYRTFSDENILLGLSFGRYAPLADKMTPEEMAQDALSVLRSVWGKAVGQPLSILTTHWSENPNFKGAYSYPQVGGTKSQYEIFKEPIKDRLFFAGEHTIFEYHSTTHGALLSGLRAAKAILDIQ
ncbi:FAD-dependent oxidoreductase [Kordiimonas sp. SCSIO 12603]|uniref:flavin monoamine oxidase family protein n=1 Tax=Kordiimonas sp. SCSIO 12603 TaxID=2829596 RepID=UPI002107A7DF|nr:FAD-dependent oxidoreductase [Kordiimonas sp. SCSIO 12603]UTW59878.1 FAD-dependent oxidoreductase [Kordiimonas sp. SCSIO 12603]